LPRRTNLAKWRALCLSLVYVVFAAHIAHWKITGKTLAPLELNEVMYTLELGIVTAGFIFMCALVVGTMIFGRFFCSWACHIMVLQDLCAWLLRKLGVGRKPIRSRLLLLVPPLTAFYMFLWPQLLRIWESRSFPQFHFATDRDGWASLVTTNFWRNLPGPTVIVLTFLVCGFFIVYLLGSRTFCTYVCPYGAIFGLADKFSPGRIRMTSSCRQCGTCTAVCTSGIRVHDEIKSHGLVVNSACLKDLDCVSACPHQAISYGFGLPAVTKTFKGGTRFGRVRYDFSLVEELILALVFVVSVLTFRGLYGQVPFLLSLAIGVILGYFAVVSLRLYSRSHVKMASADLKTSGKVTVSGRGFQVLATVLALALTHSSWVRYHEYFGLRQAAASQQAAPEVREALASSAFSHLVIADKWGLIRNARTERALFGAAMHLPGTIDFSNCAARLVERNPHDAELRMRLGTWLAARNRERDAEHEYRRVIDGLKPRDGESAPILLQAREALGLLLAKRGDFAGAASQWQGVLALEPERAGAHAELGSAYAELGRFQEAVRCLETAANLDPKLKGAYYNLGTVLAHTGRFDAAISAYEKGLEIDQDDVELLNNLGFALMRAGRWDEARAQLEAALALDPNHAHAHFNLGVLFSSRQLNRKASEHLRRAAQLDARYARLLERTQ
jgi:tetratricopeptide (TPR) repeat protein/polyferredoxin